MLNGSPELERRKDRSSFADQALEKFFASVRRDNHLLALILADADGHLIATASEGFSESSLAALAIFASDLEPRAGGFPPFGPAESGEIAQFGVGHAVVQRFIAEGSMLTLTIVGEVTVKTDQIKRIRAGIDRILKLGDFSD